MLSSCTVHKAEGDDTVFLAPDEEPDLVGHPPSDFAKKFLGELFELKRRAFEDLFVERIDVLDERGHVVNDTHGDRRLRAFGSAQLSPDCSARARAETI